MAEEVIGSSDRPLVRFEGVTKRFGSMPRSRISRSISAAMNSSRCSGRPAAARPRCCACSPASRRPMTGRILLDGEDIGALPPHLRPVNMMFQSYALFPHLTVADNVAFGLKQEKLPRKEMHMRVNDMLCMVQDGGILHPQSRINCRAGSASAWRWRARWSSGRKSSCSTSRSPRSTRSCARKRNSNCATCRRSSASPSSSSPTTRKRR